MGDGPFIKPAADKIDGIKYPIVKVAYGDAGSYTLASATNPIPTAIAGVSATTSNPSADSAGLPARQVPIKVHRCSFAQSGAGLITTDFTQIGTTGSGMAISQSSGSLVITTGTSTNAEVLLRSSFSIEGAHVARWGMVLSQRITNNNFVVMLADSIGDSLACVINSATSITVSIPNNTFTSSNVGQFIHIGAINGANGVPGRYAISSVSGNDVTFTVAGWPASGSCTVSLFGWNAHKVVYSGATATNALYDAIRRGWASGDTTATINTTASPGHIGHIQSDCSDALFADSLRASSTGYQFSTRGTRIENLPDQDEVLYLYLWAYNGSSAPASTTTWTVNFAAVEDLANQKVYIAGATRGGAGNSLPVSIIGTPTVTASTTTGAAAHDAAISGNPVRTAGRALTAAYTTVATGDTADFITTLQGVQITKPYQIPELEWTVSDEITNSTTAVRVNALAASLKQYVSSLSIATETLGAAGYLQLRSTPVASTTATIASNTLVMAATYNWKVGDRVLVTASTVTGLSAGSIYYILTVSGANLTFSATRGGGTLAISGTSVSATLSKLVWTTYLNTTALPLTQVQFMNPCDGGTGLSLEMCTPTALTSGKVTFSVVGYTAP